MKIPSSTIATIHHTNGFSHLNERPNERDPAPASSFLRGDTMKKANFESHIERRLHRYDPNANMPKESIIVDVEPKHGESFKSLALRRPGKLLPLQADESILPGIALRPRPGTSGEVPVVNAREIGELKGGMPLSAPAYIHGDPNRPCYYNDDYPGTPWHYDGSWRADKPKGELFQEMFAPAPPNASATASNTGYTVGDLSEQNTSTADDRRKQFLQEIENDDYLGSKPVLDRLEIFDLLERENLRTIATSRRYRKRHPGQNIMSVRKAEEKKRSGLEWLEANEKDLFDAIPKNGKASAKMRWVRQYVPFSVQQKLMNACGDSVIPKERKSNSNAEISAISSEELQRNFLKRVDLKNGLGIFGNKRSLAIKHKQLRDPSWLPQGWNEHYLSLLQRVVHWFAASSSHPDAPSFRQDFDACLAMLEPSFPEHNISKAFFEATLLPKTIGMSEQPVQFPFGYQPTGISSSSSTSQVYDSSSSWYSDPMTGSSTSYTAATNSIQFPPGHQSSGWLSGPSTRTQDFSHVAVAPAPLSYSANQPQAGATTPWNPWSMPAYKNRSDDYRHMTEDEYYQALNQQSR